MNPFIPLTVDVDPFYSRNGIELTDDIDDAASFLDCLDPN